MSIDTHVELNCLFDSACIAGVYCVCLTLQLGNVQTLEESGAHRLRLYLGGEALPAPQSSTLAAWHGLSLPLQQRRHQYIQLLMQTSQTICCRYEAALSYPLPSLHYCLHYCPNPVQHGTPEKLFFAK